MSSFATKTIIDASPDEVWQALSDIGLIHRWNPGVTDSYTTSEAAGGVGAARHCDLGGTKFLKEEVVAWEPGQKLTMRINETNLPFESADIRFTLQPEGERTMVTVSPLYELKFGPLGMVLDRLYVRKSYRKGMNSLLAGLKEYVEKEGKAQ